MSNNAKSAKNGTDVLWVLGLLAVILDVVVAVAELLFSDDFAGGAVRAAVLIVAAALVIGGIRLLDRRPWPGAIVASIGAVAGALMLVWTLFVIPLAGAIVALSVMRARAVTPEATLT